MMSNLALIVLKTGQTLVSQTDELEYEPKVHLLKPYIVSGKAKVTLTPWPEYTNDAHILLRSDDLLTVCEPTESIVESYAKKVGKKPEDFVVNEEDQPEFLTEDEGEVPDGDEYEPRYREEDGDSSW